MLSELERARIDEERARVPDARAAISEALMAVQESRGWVSDEAIGDVAAALGLGRAEVVGVATFFELVFRRKVGEHVILVCDSVSCWLTGADAVLDRIKSRLGIELGGTSADGRFTLLPVGCLGACEVAPAMMIDEELFGGLDPDEVDRILDRYSKEGPHGDAAHR